MSDGAVRNFEEGKLCEDFRRVRAGERVPPSARLVGGDDGDAAVARRDALDRRLVALSQSAIGTENPK